MYWKLLLKVQPSNHFPGLLFWIFPTIPPSFGTSVQKQPQRHWENLHHCQCKTPTLAPEPAPGQTQWVRKQYLHLPHETWAELPITERHCKIHLSGGSHWLFWHFLCCAGFAFQLLPGATATVSTKNAQILWNPLELSPLFTGDFATPLKPHNQPCLAPYPTKTCLLKGHWNSLAGNIAWKQTGTELEFCFKPQIPRTLLCGQLEEVGAASRPFTGSRVSLFHTSLGVQLLTK